jgi:hypothetical protein
VGDSTVLKEEIERSHSPDLEVVLGTETEKMTSPIFSNFLGSFLRCVEWSDVQEAWQAVDLIRK